MASSVCDDDDDDDDEDDDDAAAAADDDDDASMKPSCERRACARAGVCVRALVPCVRDCEWLCFVHVRRLRT